MRAGDRAGPIVVRVQAQPAGEHAETRIYGVRADRFGPAYHDCGYLGVTSHTEVIPQSSAGYAPAVSPDGTRLAFESTREGRRDIEVYDMALDSLWRVGRSGNARHPGWAPDGRRVAYVDAERSPDVLTLVSVEDGLTEHFQPGGSIYFPVWSPDGASILYDTNGYAMWVQPVAGGDPYPLRAGAHVEGEWGEQPAWSPDGALIAYLSRPGLEVLDLASGTSEEVLWDREGGIESFAWDPESGAVAYESLRSSQDHLFLYRPVEDMWCSLSNTAERRASRPAWLVPNHSLVYAGRDPQTRERLLYRLDLGP